MRFGWKKSGTQPSDGASLTGEGTQWSHGVSLGTVAARVGVFAVVVLSAIGGVRALANDSAPPPPLPVSTDTSAEVAAEELAERVVVVWLTATADSPGDYASLFDADTRSLPDVAPQVDHVSSAMAKQEGDGVWSVVVGADVTEPASEGNVGGEDGDPATVEPGTVAETPNEAPRPVRRYYRVAVVVSADGSLGVLSLPGITSTPQPGRSSLAYRVDVKLDSPQAQAVGEFLTSYLTGAGRLERVVRPGAEITPIDPAPYTTVTVTAVRAERETTADTATPDAEIRVLATATATTATGSQTHQYALTLMEREGRWEVAAIDPAPAIATTNPDTAVTTDPPSVSPNATTYP